VQVVTHGRSFRLTAYLTSYDSLRLRMQATAVRALTCEDAVIVHALSLHSLTRNEKVKGSIPLGGSTEKAPPPARMQGWGLRHAWT